MSCPPPNLPNPAISEHDRMVALRPAPRHPHRFLATIRAAQSLEADRLAAANRWSGRLGVAAALLAALLILAPALIHWAQLAGRP